MLVEHLKNQVESSLSVKLFCDLASLSETPDILLRSLNSVYQESYSPNERIVLYTSHIPSEKFLRHLYETVNFIDISNYFILICAPEEVRDLINSTCVKYSHDPIPFQFHSVNLEDTLPFCDNFVLPETICAIPWFSLEIRPNGDITPCCMTKGVVLGNIKNTTLDQAFHGPKMKKLRSDLSSGERPVACSDCWKVEDKNLTSIRIHNIKLLKKDFLLNYIDNPHISKLDIKFNNTCNFKCRICNSESSSLFAAEEHKFKNMPLVVQDNWSESSDFIDQIIAHLPDIQSIDMYGGEPFLIKKFTKVLQLAAEQGYAKNIRLHYNSNGSIWPEQFLKYWPHFKLVDIHFSIDAVGDQFELQRGGSWEEVESNIVKLKNLNLPNLSINIMPTVSVMNIYYIDRVYDWATAHGFTLFVSHIRGEGLEIQNLTKDAKDLILKKFKDHPWAEMQKLLEIIQQLPDNDGAQFRAKVKWFDDIRQENFAETHPEIAFAMRYSV